MANGDDKPAFDPSQPFTAVDDKPPFDPTKPFTAGAAPQIGGARAAYEGLKSGVTAGFSDELAGMPAVGTDVDAGAMAFMTPEQHAQRTQQMQSDIAEARATREAAQAQHPYLYGAGELGGAGATMFVPGMGAARGATLAERAAQAAKFGAGYGAVSGAGYGSREGGLPGAVVGAGTGAVAGGVLGAAAEPVMSAAGALARPITSRIGSAYRALTDPEGEAARQILQAGTSDIASARAGQWQPLTQEQVNAANVAGLERTPIDVLGPQTRALGEWAATQSPEAAASIRTLADERFKRQPQRVAQFIQDMTGGGDLFADRTALKEGAKAVNRPAYRAAYEAGDFPLGTDQHPELQELLGSNTVSDAVRGAIRNWQDFRMMDGYGAMNPSLRITPDGMLESTGGRGMPPYPNLQLWDYARRTLSGLAQGAKDKFGGETQDSARYGFLASRINDALDKYVPEYGVARSGAAQFFGAQKAEEAGAKFANMQSNFNMGRARAALANMTDDERNLFARGYATEQANRVLKGGGVRSLGLPQTQERTAMALGQDNANQLEALLRAEQVVNSTRNVYTGSPTARRMAQMAGMGIGFGAAEGTAEDVMTGHFDPAHAITAAMVGGLGMGKVALNQRLATRIGRMITSDDPAIYRRGVEMLSKSSPLMNGLRRATSGAPVAAQPRLSLPAPAAADDQQNVPGPVQQRQAGGRVSEQKKSTKTEAHYRGGTRRHHCAICSMFVKPSSCTSVRGHISPRALCDFYEPKGKGERIVDNKYDVVTGANSSKKPTGPIFIDRHIPEWSPKLRTKNGKRVRLWTYLSLHEDEEQKRMEKGETYDAAHEGATLAEKNKAEADGVNWKAYTDEVNGYLDRIEHEKVTRKPPVPLHVKPEAALKGGGHHHSSHKNRHRQGGGRVEDEPPSGDPISPGIGHAPVLQIGIGPGFVGSSAPGAAPLEGTVISPSSPNVAKAITRANAWMQERAQREPQPALQRNIEIMMRGGPMAEATAKHMLRTFQPHPSEMLPSGGVINMGDE